MADKMIYTVGYSRWKVGQLKEWLASVNGILVDVRWARRSRNPDFSGKRLEEAFGDSYVALDDFGNLNYKGGGPEIRLLDFEGGAEKLAAIVAATGKNPVLMCACAEAAECHRAVVAQRLSELWKCSVNHLHSPTEALGAADQLNMF